MSRSASGSCRHRPVADAVSVLKALQECAQSFGGGKRGVHNPSPSWLVLAVAGRFDPGWRSVRVVVVGVRRARRTQLRLEVDPAADHRSEVRTQLGGADPSDPLLCLRL